MPENTGETPIDYSTRVAEIGGLPRKTPEQRQAARERIAEVRRGVRKDRFAVSFAAAFLEPILVKNPHLTPDEARVLVETADLPPEARFTAFKTIDALRSQAQNVTDVLLSLFPKDDWGDAAALGTKFFRAYTRKKQSGVCGLYREPFGIYLAVGEKDFRVLDERENVGGFYQENARVKIGKRTHRFPLIVTLGQPTDEDVERGILPHERGHGYEAAFKAGLERNTPSQGTKEKHWGGDLNDQKRMKEELIKIINSARDIGRLKRFSIFRSLVERKETQARGDFAVWARNFRHQALGAAKGEFFATLYATPNDLGQRGESLKKKGYVYDYLSKVGLGAAEKTLLRDEAIRLRDSYNAEIDQATVAAKKIESFLSGLGFKESGILTLGLLAPEPIERWSIFYDKNFSPERVAAYDQFRSLMQFAQSRANFLGYLAGGCKTFGEAENSESWTIAERGLRADLAEISGRLQKSFEEHLGEIPMGELAAEETNLRAVISKAELFDQKTSQEERRLHDRLDDELQKTPAFYWRSRLKAESGYFQAVQDELSDGMDKVVSGLLNQAGHIVGAADIDNFSLAGSPPQVLEAGFKVAGEDGLRKLTITLDTPGKRVMAQDLLQLKGALGNISRLVNGIEGKQLTIWNQHLDGVNDAIGGSDGSIGGILQAAKSFLDIKKLDRLHQLGDELRALRKRVSNERKLIREILRRYQNQ